MTADPYEPPKRHRDRSGALVRFLIVAVLLGGAVFAYTQMDHGPGLIAEEPQQEQMAEMGADGSYQVTPTPPLTEAPASPTAEPATAPAERSTSAPQPAVPPPSTTIGAPPAG